MKIKSIEYSRLFNLSNYNNERIGIVIELDENDDEIQAWQLAFNDVMALHCFFEVHRRIADKLGSIIDDLRDLEKKKSSEELELLELQKKHEEMQRRIEAWKKGELEPKAVNESMLCEFGALEERIDRTIKRIGDLETTIKELQEDRELYTKVLKKLREDIESGEIYRYLDFFNEGLLRMMTTEIAKSILNR